MDRKLTGPKEKILLGGRKIDVLHAPGRSRGSVVFLTESDGLKVLFAHDLHGPLYPALLSNCSDYGKSLGMQLSIGADILCEGHYGLYRGKAKITAYIQQFMKD